MNKLQFMRKYSFDENDSINPLLAKWNNIARNKRPIIGNELKSTVCQSGKTAQIWIQSDACRFSKLGACTCCDYFQGQPDVDQVNAFVSALSQMDPSSNTIVLNTCGSVLDKSELKTETLVLIIDEIAKTNISTVVLETHLNTITEEILKILLPYKNILDIYFEIGIETLNRDINQFILNKLPFDRNINRVIGLIHSYGFRVTGNVMTGFPFLDYASQVLDSVTTIRTLLDTGIDFIVLFPINIKKYTFMYDLYDNGFYKVVNGRILIDILTHFSQEELEYINVGWYGEPRIDIPGYKSDDMIVPYYCEKCYKQMMQLWLDYNCAWEGSEREQILSNMKAIVCSCNYDQLITTHKVEIDFDSLDKAYQHFYSSTDMEE